MDIAKIRNVAFVGHGGVGKTSLVEAILFACGASSRLGRVDDGTTTTDFDPDEIKRKISRCRPRRSGSSPTTTRCPARS
jgi:elongation factor G